MYLITKISGVPKKHYIQLVVKLLNFQRRIDIKFTFTGELLHSLPDKYCKSSIKPPWGLISSTFEGGVGGESLTERGCFFLNDDSESDDYP